MTITITAFERSPDRGKGLARDMRVRGALEEVGQPYDVRLVSFGAMKEPAHRRLHPFGQIPTYEEVDLVLFESGAIVVHVAQRHSGLLPDDANARARAIAWMFAALNTVEPTLVEVKGLLNKQLLCEMTPNEYERMRLPKNRSRYVIFVVNNALAEQPGIPVASIFEHAGGNRWRTADGRNLQITPKVGAVLSCPEVTKEG